MIVQVGWDTISTLGSVISVWVVMTPFSWKLRWRVLNWKHNLHNRDVDVVSIWRCDCFGRYWFSRAWIHDWPDIWSSDGKTVLTGRYTSFSEHSEHWYSEDYPHAGGGAEAYLALLHRRDYKRVFYRLLCTQSKLWSLRRKGRYIDIPNPSR